MFHVYSVSRTGFGSQRGSFETKRAAIARARTIGNDEFIRAVVHDSADNVVWEVTPFDMVARD